MDNNFYTQTLDRVDFTDQNLSRAFFSCATLTNCTFTRADLSGASFQGVRIEDLLTCTFDGAILTGASFDPGILLDKRMRNIFKSAAGLKIFTITTTRTETETYLVTALDEEDAFIQAKKTTDFNSDNWDDWDIEFKGVPSPSDQNSCEDEPISLVVHNGFN